MNTSGEAADQVVRMSLEVGQAALKISGTGAKQLAVLLYAILKEQKKTKGRVKLETLVRSGKPLTVFSVKESDLRKFVQEAKRYGVLYCAVRNPRVGRDGMVDIIVKAEDASRINRIVERFRFASVSEVAQVKTEIQKSREEKSHIPAETGQSKEKKSAGKTKQEVSSQAEPEKDRPNQAQEDKLMDELLGEALKKDGQQQNPSLAKTEKSRQSEPISGKHRTAAEGTSKLYIPVTPNQPSVREELRDIQMARKKEAETQRRDPVSKTTKNKSQQQMQNQRQNRKKSKKVKER
ncbi:MAG: PcfB family protein [Muricomes sp.]